MSHRTLLGVGLVALITADLVLARAQGLAAVGIGVAIWGLHMGLTQGLMATMVADTAPASLRGTAFGFFNLASGIAMLIASVLAGLLWHKLGAPATFYAGAAFSVLSFILLVKVGRGSAQLGR
jgi:MFS family permease